MTTLNKFAGLLALLALVGVLAFGFVLANIEMTVNRIAAHTGTVTTNSPTNYDYLQLGQALGFYNVDGQTTNVAVNETAVRHNLTSGTTTPCAILNPFGVTSTVLALAYNITTATSTAMTYAIGTSTTAYATSTSMANLGVTGGAQATLTWDPSSNNGVIGPSQWVVVGQNGTGFTTGVVTGGNCTATFETDN